MESSAADDSFRRPRQTGPSARAPFAALRGYLGATGDLDLFRQAVCAGSAQVGSQNRSLRRASVKLQSSWYFQDQFCRNGQNRFADNATEISFPVLASAFGHTVFMAQISPVSACIVLGRDAPSWQHAAHAPTGQWMICSNAKLVRFTVRPQVWPDSDQRWRNNVAGRR